MTAAPADATPRDVIIDEDAWRQSPFGAETAEAIVYEAVVAVAMELQLGPHLGFAVLLANDKTLRDLNRVHRGVDRSTNVLSFPAFDPGQLPDAGHIGDIAIALETVLAESSEAHIRPEHHLAHMVVHGVAHLAGLDHEDDAEAEEMEALEARALARLGAPNPYQPTSDEE